MTKPFVIPKALVWEAFRRVKANGGSAGVDEESIEEFEGRLGDNLYKLWNRLSSGSYVPPPVKAVPIPKKSGGTRTLGVPTVADRVAQPVERRKRVVIADDVDGRRLRLGLALVYPQPHFQLLGQANLRALRIRRALGQLAGESVDADGQCDRQRGDKKRREIDRLAPHSVFIK